MNLLTRLTSRTSGGAKTVVTVVPTAPEHDEALVVRARSRTVRCVGRGRIENVITQRATAARISSKRNNVRCSRWTKRSIR
jgi:hypothetical protein